MNKPLISIVLPVYNVERYLGRCIDSLLAQTFEDFEAILVDDGSTDSCGAICDRYAAQDSRIRVIHQPNAGTMAARRRGYSAAKGDYIVFCDSDDAMPLHALATLYRAAREQQTDIVFGGHTVRYDNGNSRTCVSQLPEIRNREEMQRSMLKHLVLCSLYGNIYKRELFTGYDYHIPSALLHEDRLMLVQLIDRSQTFGSLDEPVYDYYQNDTSITRNRLTEKKLKGALDACEWLVEYMQEKGMCVNEAKEFYVRYMNWQLEHGYDRKLIEDHSPMSRTLSRYAECRTFLPRYYALHTRALHRSCTYRLCCRVGRRLLRLYREQFV